MVKGYSPIRWSKVLELRAKLNQYENLTRDQQFVILFENVKTPEDGISNREISLTIRPKEVEVDKNGNTTPTFKAMHELRVDLSQFRASKLNKGLTPIFFKDAVTGMFLYYWVQKVKDYDTMIRIKKLAKDGMDRHTEIDLKNIRKSKTTKDQFVSETIFNVKQKNRKRKDSDSVQ